MGIQLADGPAQWTCALVNNMPDAAFGATERQFVGLLDAASGCETVVLTRYTMAGTVSLPHFSRRHRSDQ